MSRHLMVLWNEADRKKAWRYIAEAPEGTRLTFQENVRSISQNERMWLILACISRQLDWHGQKYSEEQWKDWFMHAYRGEKWMPAEDGGMVPIGRSTSNLSKSEFSELMELMESFCVRQGINLPWDHDQAP